MREYLAKTRKIGDCIVITLPKDLVQVEQIQGDMVVKITVQKCPKGGLIEKGSSLGDDPWRQLE